MHNHFYPKNDSNSKSVESKKWKCTSECKPLSDNEVKSILNLREAFELPLEDVRHALATCDNGCPNGHYTKLINFVPFPCKGHPIVCYLDSGCTSQLRILRAASTHFPVLRHFLHQVTVAIASHKCIYEIDAALSAGDYHKLMEITNEKSFESLLSNDVDCKYEQCTSNKYSVSPS